MSDIREHVSDSLEDRLLHMARTSAFMHRGDHGYLPGTHDEAAKFVPHEWVLHAMKRAYEAGKKDGADEVRSTLRRVIGV